MALGPRLDSTLDMETLTWSWPRQAHIKTRLALFCGFVALWFCGVEVSISRCNLRISHDEVIMLLLQESPISSCDLFFSLFFPYSPPPFRGSCLASIFLAGLSQDNTYLRNRGKEKGAVSMADGWRWLAMAGKKKKKRYRILSFPFRYGTSYYSNSFLQDHMNLPMPTSDHNKPPHDTAQTIVVSLV